MRVTARSADALSQDRRQIGNSINNGLLVDVKPLYGRSTWAILLPVNCENKVLPGEQASVGKFAGKQTRRSFGMGIGSPKKFSMARQPREGLTARNRALHCDDSYWVQCLGALIFHK
jgi:hypothetical protein